jgi:hypothetical protein
VVPIYREFAIRRFHLRQNIADPAGIAILGIAAVMIDQITEEKQ